MVAYCVNCEIRIDTMQQLRGFRQRDATAAGGRQAPACRLPLMDSIVALRRLRDVVAGAAQAPSGGTAAIPVRRSLEPACGN